MSAPYYTADGITLHLGESLDILPTMPDNSIDAIVCDPPYGLADHHPRVIAAALAAWLGGDRAFVPDGKGFMGHEWDRFVPPPAVWDQCLRVLKPGGHLVAFAGTRTVDLMTLSIRLAGFEVRDSLHWIYGAGMPKGQNIGKSIDRRRDDRGKVLQVTAWLTEQVRAGGWDRARLNALFGFHARGQATHWITQGVAACVPTPEQWDRIRDALGFDDAALRPLVAELNGRKGTLGDAWAQREVVGVRTAGVGTGNGSVSVMHDSDNRDMTAPATEEARQWHGWNTQLKPAHEPIVLARKSTGFHTTVANVLQHGTGALNIDACRTSAGQDYKEKCASVVGIDSPRNGDTGGERNGIREDSAHVAGRWPTNVLLTHPPLLDEAGQVVGDACADGCALGCPVAEMDAQSGYRADGPRTAARSGKSPGTYGAFTGQALARKDIGDGGGASRFFTVFRYEAKAPKSQRPSLEDGTAHPTVKPLALMSWLIRLVTPPGGTVLDWCAGSGTTLEAAVLEGVPVIGVERYEPYARLCVARLSKPMATSLFGGGW